ncbi:MAG: hypothetical protein HYT79_10650 [Elusimicrobia bacterium]|nr:hypothetical protein [Elusimicrobiota bacterium]
MTRTLALSAIAALMFAANINAEEHPKEHPSGTAPAAAAQEPSKEHPSGTAPAAAKEHPKEHPAGAAASEHKEHPKGKEHPEHPKGKPAQAPEGSKAWMKQIRNEYDAKVCEVGKGKSKTESYTIHDDKLNKDWELRVVKVHKNRIVQLGKNQFFACSDFKSVKKGEKDKLDLDFFATKNPDGSWTIDKVLIHKVNGVPRYTWNEKNEMAPAGN